MEKCITSLPTSNASLPIKEILSIQSKRIPVEWNQTMLRECSWLLTLDDPVDQNTLLLQKFWGDLRTLRPDQICILPSSRQKSSSKRIAVLLVFKTEIVGNQSSPPSPTYFLTSDDNFNGLSYELLQDFSVYLWEILSAVLYQYPHMYVCADILRTTEPAYLHTRKV